MTPKLKQTATMVRILSAVGALSFPIAVPSMGAPMDLVDAAPDVPTGISSVDQSGARAKDRVAQTLTGIEVQPGNDGISVVIFGDGELAYDVTKLGQRRLVIDIPRVASAIRKPVMAVNHRLLKHVRVGYHADKVRVVFDLAGTAQHSVETQENSLLVRLSGGAEDGELTLARDEARVSPVTQQETKSSDNLGLRQESGARKIHGTRIGARPAAAVFRVRPAQMATEPETAERHTPKNDVVLGETRYVGRRISLDFQQADISNVLRLIAEVSGFNIVIGEGVKSKVTMKLVSVPWDQALEMILKMNGLGKIKQGNILWIDSLANIAKQQDEEFRMKQSKVQAEELVDRVFYIRNLQAQELMTAVRQNLSPRGKMQVSIGTNALVVQDAESRINVLKEIIEGLDLAVPQVNIEARIVQADTVYARGLGVQWGIKNTDIGGNTFSGVGNLTGPFAPIAGTGGTTIPRDFLVNLPAQVAGLPSVPAIGYTFGKLADGFALDMRLSAGELLGLAKVIAAPKVTTLDKREAKISQGESIPFQTTSLQGTQTTFVDANLELNVTPQITSRDPKEVGKQIMMKVRATRNAVGARSNPAGPSIDRREANTQVIVRDGETMVIGGVFIDAQNNNVQGVPYLSRIPVLGWLFKNKSESVSKQELLIFLTPSIVPRS
jgi:type IV pilus assembly protein PilQ